MRYVGLLCWLMMTVSCVYGMERSISTSSSVGDNDCPICFKDLSELPTQELPCDPERKISHKFHEECLKTWWQCEKKRNCPRSCPICRQEVTNPPACDTFLEFLRALFSENA